MSGSTVKMVIWLPESWNGKLVTVGGGGLNGGLGNSDPDMSAAVAQGYAGVLGDTGHENSQTARWAFGHPQKIVDFAWRGNHLTAIAAKSIVAAYYGRPATRNYFEGCSGGGREALMLAQHNPEDYDGIVAGAPAANFGGLMTAGMWKSRFAVRDPNAAGLVAKLGLLRSAAVRQCDRIDGVADGVIADPRACGFDPVELQCRPGADASTCLTAAEVAAARSIYTGPRTAAGARIVPGMPVGSEEGWAPFITENGIGATILGGEYFRWVVHQDANWKAGDFDLDRDLAAAKSGNAASIDALDPDLRPFVRRGGKLLIYHGWEDPVIPATATLDYYGRMRNRLGPEAARGVRLFMLPGVGHCQGGHGPSSFDRLSALDTWVTKRRAPERIVAVRYAANKNEDGGSPNKVVESRPVCAWPGVARYRGSGSIDEAASFVCRQPAPER